METQEQSIIRVIEPGTTTLTSNIPVLLQHGNSPTAIILALAILLLVLRPVMLR